MHSISRNMDTFYVEEHSTFVFPMYKNMGAFYLKETLHIFVYLICRNTGALCNQCKKVHITCAWKHFWTGLQVWFMSTFMSFSWIRIMCFIGPAHSETIFCNHCPWTRQTKWNLTQKQPNFFESFHKPNTASLLIVLAAGIFELKQNIVNLSGSIFREGIEMSRSPKLDRLTLFSYSVSHHTTTPSFL